jgi:predicted dehydrogenase
MKMKKIKTGIIGCGPRSQGSTMRNLLNIREYELVAICDPISELMEKSKKMWEPQMESVETYTDHMDMLKNADIEAVFVVVEPENNARLVCDALNAGKDTYCDVPLAINIEECWQIVTTVEKTGRKFLLGEQIRYAPHTMAWRNYVREGKIGKPLYVSGQYLHGMGDDRYYIDSITGERINYQDLDNFPNAKKSRAWNLKHPIHYLPHELSPLLKVIDDRVTRVSCIGTRSDKGYIHEWFPQADMEVALMQTEKDVILRMAVGFTVETMNTGGKKKHWHHVMGTKGVLEEGRNPQIDSGQAYFEDDMMTPNTPAQITWSYNSSKTSKSVLDSGHGGTDYWPYKDFAKWMLDDNYDTSEMLTVYKAADTAAPAIIAGISAERRGDWIDVPDFRPDADRKLGEMPIGL